MACGVPVVSNSGPQVEWYCEHGVNSLIAKPFPSAIFEQIELLILNRDLREKLIENGIAKTSDSDWVKESIKIQNFIESNL
jgi:glycosyltransferase involved in cell wall biosynthesis